MGSDFEAIYKESPSKRIINFFAGIWPSIYRLINDFLYGTWGFIKDTVTSVWRRG